MKVLKVSLQVAITICLSFFTTGYSLANSIDVSGDITENIIWQADTVKVKGNVTVLDGVTLTIEPGSIVEFHGHYSLNIYGVLLAVGTAADTITFSMYDTMGLSSALPQDSENGGWRGIFFDNGASGAYGAMSDNDTSRINCCKLEYMKNSLAAIDVQYFSRLIISNSHFNNNYVAQNIIRGNSSSFRFHDNKIQYNHANKFIYVENNSSSPLIKDNLIYHNFCGGISVGSNCVPVIEGNTICNNVVDIGASAAGITLFRSDAQVINNLICNNTGNVANSGGGIYMYDSDALLINNTVCNNESKDNGGGLLVDLGNPQLLNNIFWGNAAVNSGNQMYFSNDGSGVEISHCAIEGGTTGIWAGGGTYNGIYLDNIESDPSFTNPSAGAGKDYNGWQSEWTLTTNSPCINTGTTDQIIDVIPDNDLAANTRIRYGMIDIGAYEYIQENISVCGAITTNTTWMADRINVTCDISINSSSTLEILPGSVVEFDGHYKMEIADGRLLAIGTEKDNIKFTSADTTGLSNPDNNFGGWGGIRFLSSINTSNDSSKLNHCIIEYAKNQPSSAEIPKNCGGAIFVDTYPKIHISNCVIRSNMAYRGGGLYLTNNADISILDNLIIENFSYNSGGGIHSSGSNPDIINNVICNNSAGNGGGLFISGATQQSGLFNNVVCNNEARTNKGGGIVSDGNVKFINHVICNNYSLPDFCGGAAIENNQLINCIIWNNTNSQVESGSTDSPEIYNSNIQGGLSGISGGESLGTFQNIIDSFPSFKNPSEDIGVEFNGYLSDWSLLSLSPCINSGTSALSDITTKDLLGNPRVHDVEIDLGAIEHQGGLPVFNQAFSGGIFCEGDQLSMNANSSDTAFFQWQRNGKSLPGENSSTISYESLTISDTGFYKCIAKNAYGNTTSDSSHVQIIIIPKITTQPVNKTVCASEYILLAFDGEFTDIVEFQWRKNFEDIPAAASQDFQLIDADPDDNGTYFCYVSDECMSITTDTIQVLVNPSPPGISLGTDTLICENSELIIDAGGGFITYEWSNGTTNQNISVIEDGEYYVTGTDNAGCKSYSDTINILISDIQLQFQKNNISCYGFNDGTAELSIMGSGLKSIAWNTGDTIPGISGLGAGWYMVTVIDSLGCSTVDSIEILEPSKLSADITDSINVSAPGNSDGSATITPSGGTPPYAYYWDDDLNGIDSIVTGLSANTWYHGFVTDVNSCTIMDSVILAEPGILHTEITDSSNVTCNSFNDGSATVTIGGGIPPYSILWNDEAGSSSQMITDLSPGRWYSVSVTDAGMQTVKDSVYISGPESIIIESVIPGILCPGESNGSISINAYGGTPPYEYLWSTDATTTSITNIPEGKYWVEVTDFNDCIKSDTIIISSNPIAPEARICIVSLDTLTGKNMVIWEKDQGKGIKSYKIYRQGSTILDTVFIGTVPFDSLSIFVDKTSQPDVYAHKYWITTVDSCGNESTYSPYHQAMLLTTGLGTDRINLTWTEYEAEEIDNVIIGYTIYRSNTFMNYREINAIPSNTPFYPDIDPPAGQNYYLVAAVLQQGCKPTSKSKAGSGPYVHSLSNMDDNKLRNPIGIGDLLSTDGIIIYPNPARDKFTIRFANPMHKEYQLILTDMTGKVLKIRDNITEDLIEINRVGLSDGLYLIELRGPKIFRAKIVIE